MSLSDFDQVLQGATDGTNIGNVGDSLKVSAGQSGTWDVNNVSGTVSLPTGAATSVNQTTANTSLGTIATTLTLAQGSATSGQTGSLTFGAVTTAAPTYTTGQTSPLSLGTSGLLRTSTTISNDGKSATYAACASGLVTASSATDIFTITGSATKTVKISAILINGTTTSGSSAAVNVTFVKRSTANTGGTSSSITPVPNDSASASGTATVRSYTANPTLGTLVGVVRAKRMFVVTASSPGVSDPINYRFGENSSEPLVLRGTSEVLAINLNATTVTGPVFSVSMEWIEE